jgi:hypothetical protein
MVKYPSWIAPEKLKQLQSMGSVREGKGKADSESIQCVSM